MSKRFLTAAAAVAVTMSAAQAAHAAVVTFDDRVIATQDLQTEANQFDEQGLHFEGFQFMFVPPNNPLVALANGYDSNFMETGLEAVTVSLTGGGVFDFTAIKLALGAFNDGVSDNVLVTGTKANCAVNCTVSTNLTVTTAFQNFDLAGFTGLSSLVFGMPTIGGPNGDTEVGYLAFDALSFQAQGAVPEPAAWAMMLLGFGALGAALRRRRQAGVSATA